VGPQHRSWRGACELGLSGATIAVLFGATGRTALVVGAVKVCMAVPCVLPRLICRVLGC
jgi:hypothetical protein